LAVSETASFYDGSGLPVLGEYLGLDATAHVSFTKDVRALARCRTLTFTQSGRKFRATIKPLALGPTRSTSAAFTLEFTDAGLRIVTDLVLFADSTHLGELVFADSTAPSVNAIVRVSDEAENKAEGRPVKPQIVSISAAPIRVAQTSMGPVGYREFGSGPPLVLIMGYGGTMETWDPHFVDALAQVHRVIVFDNAGVGTTQALSNDSIDDMANQTSALINALDLTKPDVLGWSMGGMIAQALAVEHPTQVRRLVLAATFPGLGSVKPSRGAINDLRSSNTNRVMSVLFPANQETAVEDYEIATSDYPSAPSLSASTVSAQTNAVDRWFAGRDLTGRRTAEIDVPTLVADGAEDLLDPTVNDHSLASLIPGARLVLYPDAGHAFLFQDEAMFVPLVNTFLNGS
jgi:pimeloyl-ACP methyl ester carboxylesterase